MNKIKYDKSLVKKLKKEAIHKLNIFDIEDTFTLRIKQPDDDEWVAQYRALSQFLNGGRGPIFWLSPELLRQHEEFIVSVLHEYGHVIAEYAWVHRNKKLMNLISKEYPGNFFNRPWDEEAFAEDFAQVVYGNDWAILGIKKICKEYIKNYNKIKKLSLADVELALK